MTLELCAAITRLLASLSYDDSGSMGRGGNGGLISRETIRAADELRLAMSHPEPPEPRLES